MVSLASHRSVAIHAGMDESTRESARCITNPSELIKRVKWSSRACTTHGAANVRAVNPIIYGFTRVEWHAKRFKWLGDRSSLVDRDEGSSRRAPLEDRLAMLLKGVQARLQSMKHRGRTIGVLSGLS